MMMHVDIGFQHLVQVERFHASDHHGAKSIADEGEDMVILLDGGLRVKGGAFGGIFHFRLEGR